MTQTAGKWLTQAEVATISQRAHAQALKAVCAAYPALPTFAATEKSDGGRTHRLRTKRTHSLAAFADAETSRICDIHFAALQPFSPKRSFALPKRAPGQTVRTPHDSRRMDVPFLPA